MGQPALRERDKLWLSLELPFPCSIASGMNLQVLRCVHLSQAVHPCPACLCNSSLCCSARGAQRQYVLDVVQMAQNALLHELPAIERMKM